MKKQRKKTKMMKNKVVCRFCKKEINKSTAYKKNETDRNYYCNEEHWQLSQDKIKYKPNKTKSNGEDNPRRLLLDYIQEIYVNNGWDKHDINWKLITSRIKNIMDEDSSITYGGIQYTLWYCKEIKELDLFSDKSNSIIWCVPFNYQEAQKYYLQTEELEDEINNWSFESEPVIIKQVKEIKHFKKISIDNLI